MPAERTDEEIAWEALAEVPDTWSINSWEFRLIVRRACENARAQGAAEGMEEAAKVADARCAEDQAAYKDEQDWRQPYACNRVIRASMDIAAAIRSLAAERRGKE